MATTVGDIERAKTEGKIAVMFATQNADFILDPSFAEVFSVLGFMIIHLTYQYRNLIGDGCGETKPTGLSRFGVQVVEKMSKAGIVIDLSHVSKATSLEVIELSKNPVIYSHSGLFAMVPSIRNRVDEEIKALRALSHATIIQLPWASCVSDPIEPRCYGYLVCFVCRAL